MMSINQKGDFGKITKYLNKVERVFKSVDLDRYGREGVSALASATPVDTGKTAVSWSYEIKKTNDALRVIFNNSNVNDGVKIALVVQYGHATGTGGWVEGRDYINPAVRPIFDNLASAMWKEVTDS